MGVWGCKKRTRHNFYRFAVQREGGKKGEGRHEGAKGIKVCVLSVLEDGYILIGVKESVLSPSVLGTFCYPH